MLAATQLAVAANKLSSWYCERRVRRKSASHRGIAANAAFHINATSFYCRTFMLFCLSSPKQAPLVAVRPVTQ